MSAIEYALVLLSVIYGLILIVFVGGWSKMIRKASNIKISVAHLIWNVNLTAYLIFRWYWDYWYHIEELKSPIMFTIAFIRPVLLFISAELLFDPDSDSTDFPQRMANVGTKFFGVISFLWIYEISYWLLIGKNIFELGSPRIIVVGLLLISMVSFFIKNSRVRLFASIISFLLILLLVR